MKSNIFEKFWMVLWLIVITLHLFTGCININTPKNDTQKVVNDNLAPITKDTTQDIQGDLETTYYDSGRKLTEGGRVKNTKHGEWRTYFDNDSNSIKVSERWDNGFLNGVKTSYYEDGSIMSLTYWTQGNHDSTTQYTFREIKDKQGVVTSIEIDTTSTKFFSKGNNVEGNSYYSHEKFNHFAGFFEGQYKKYPLAQKLAVIHNKSEFRIETPIFTPFLGNGEGIRLQDNGQTALLIVSKLFYTDCVASLFNSHTSSAHDISYHVVKGDTLRYTIDRTTTLRRNEIDVCIPKILSISDSIKADIFTEVDKELP